MSEIEWADITCGFCGKPASIHGESDDGPYTVCPVEAPMTTAQSLREAADVIERNGLATGTYVDKRPYRLGLLPIERCPMCAIGAISYAITGEPDPENVGLADANNWPDGVVETYTALVEWATGETFGDRDAAWAAMTAWSDDREVAEVSTAMRHAAEWVFSTQDSAR